jgi:hypothetical protein
MKSEAVAAESPGGGLSVKAARDVLIKNNGHVGVLTESIVSSSDAKSEDSHEESKERSAGDANDKTGKSEAGGSDMHARSSSSQNTRTSIFDVAASSSSYMDDSVTKNHDPHSLYGSFTWKVPNFKDVSKRELKSSSFSVGPYKWYILVYPNGCDVSNHLSLFLCVADYDKLLPGWSHFAQFTIAVVNKDPKKSKYSDTLHRFCKKEHDWGWKKFMELGKMQDGFVVSDTLVIKVQVQVIKDRQVAPFRTLDTHYRKELIRVYLSNIEGIVRRSVEKTKDLVAQLLERGVEDFWSELTDKQREKLSSTPCAPLLKSFTKVFFNEKEVTSTLMMDAAYCAMKVLDLSHKRTFEGLAWNSSDEDAPGTQAFRDYVDSLNGNIYLCESKNAFVFKDDALEMLASFVLDPLSVYPFTETNVGEGSKAESNEKESSESSDVKVSAERDELKLIDLARLTMEVFAMAQIAEQNIDNAWKEAEIIRRQEELIREEEEAHKDQAVRLAAKAEAERERKARKKERQRAKKEAERVKLEAIEAAKAREEELKKIEQEKKRQEAEERKRQEEAKKEAERQRQLELKQAALTAKKLAKAKTKSLDEAEKSVTNTQDDTDSLEDSSGISSARSDQSSKCASKASKPGTTSQQTLQGGEDASRSSGSTQENIVAEMRLLLQKRDDEIVFLKERIKTLEEDLENALARVQVNSSPSTPSQSKTAGLQPLDESSMQSTASPTMQQAAVTSHAYIIQQMAKTSNPPDVMLSGAVPHRVSQATNGMKSSGSHKDIANMMNASRSSGLNYRVGTQNQAGRSQIHPTQARQQQMGQRGPQYMTGYNGNTMINSSKVVGYGQFSQQGTTPGAPVPRPVMNPSQNRLSPKVNNTRGYQTGNDVIQPSMNQSDGHQTHARHMGEGSGLDDFAHLGLITDLLE